MLQLINLLIYTWIFLLAGGTVPAQSVPAVYEVLQATDSIRITGTGEDLQWEKALLLSDFKQPWDKEISQPTTFQALWNQSDFYFLYKVIDYDIVAPGPDGDKQSVLPSDRVEIFFKVNKGMRPYYCLEMDPRNRVLDYEANFYRQFDLEWEWPEEALEVIATQTEDGFVVEGRIPLAMLREYQMLDQNNQLEIGLFRGDYYHTDASENETAVRWISWIVPETDTPDFHIPSAFGRFILKEQ